MSKSFRRWTIGLAAAGLGILVPVGAAWACLGIAGLTTNSASVQPGGTLGVTLTEFGATPAQIHLDSVTGPVLATVAHPGKGMSGLTTTTVTIPAGTADGQHVLIATEPGNGMLAGIPARAVIQVGNAVPASASAARPASVTTASGTSVGSLALIALAVAAVGLFLAGSLTLVGSRRRPQAEAVKAE
ncbi:MAG: carbohydrate-binding protein [Acidimicrobiales bacterium]